MAQFIAIRALHRSAGIRVVQAENEVQSVTVDATGGTFTLSYDGDETGALAFNAAASAIQTALEGLDSLDAGDVFVSGGPGDDGGTTPYLVSFTSSGDVETLVADDTNLTGGAATATVAVDTAGQTGGRKVKVTPEADVIVDVDLAHNRRALNRHSAIGQYIITATNSNVGGTDLPANN